jgi:hypothetical protein
LLGYFSISYWIFEIDGKDTDERPFSTGTLLPGPLEVLAKVNDSKLESVISLFFLRSFALSAALEGVMCGLPWLPPLEYEAGIEQE